MRRIALTPATGYVGVNVSASTYLRLLGRRPSRQELGVLVNLLVDAMRPMAEAIVAEELARVFG